MNACAPRPDFAQAPFIVIWEVTRACDLACRHCRADAQHERMPGELTTAEGLALLTHIREEFGEVLLVFTGGDPLKRDDLHRLIAHAASIGLRPTITPSVTPLLTDAAIAELKASGIARMALSLDGADAATHDAFRGVAGTFERTLAAFAAARRIGLETQLNTTIARHNLDQIERMAELAGWLGVTLWSVFSLVATGRALPSQVPSPPEQERIYRALASLAVDPRTGFDIKTTAGQPYYRVLAQTRAAQTVASVPIRDTRGRAPRGVNDGNGFVFVSHTGDICPSGFLPLVTGNVRTHRLADIYRTHELFARLRRPETFSGKCGVCEYRNICGGSRSRAYAMTGDPFGCDPTCIYLPKGVPPSHHPCGS